MNILITGANGFLGKNLFSTLKNIQAGLDCTNSDLSIEEIYLCTRGTQEAELETYCQDADFIFHFAGINRSDRDDMFECGNVGLTADLLRILRRCGNHCPIVFSSSTQAGVAGLCDMPYGRSKRKCEELLRAYSKETGACVNIYRFTNVFGKWGKPYYNSVVATFCHQIARDIPITIDAPDAELSLVYVDDLIREMLQALRGVPRRRGDFCYVEPVHAATVLQIADILRCFHAESDQLQVPQLREGSFEKCLYSTYLSYLPAEKMHLPLCTHEDLRGSFTELLKLGGSGQISVNVTKPGITKGNHWHQSKCEAFVVISGEGVISQRMLGTQQIVEHSVSGRRMETIRILPGYVHSITNLSDSEDLITLIWANEEFDAEKPDTFFEVVE